MNIAANQHGGEWDKMELSILLSELKLDEDVDLELLGFTEDDISALLKAVQPPGPPEEFEDPEMAVPNNTRQVTCPKCGYEWREGTRE